MKYIEPVKSIVLFLLVMLSIVLTFINWTYTSDYEYIEKTEVKEIEIGTKKTIDEVIKPYKVIFQANDGLTGTSSNVAIKDIMSAFGEWTALDLEQVNSNASSDYVNDMIRTKNRLTLFFSGEVPFSMFHSILKFTNKELPETTFNSIIIDWDDYVNKELDVFFVSSNNTSLLRSHVKIPDANQFIEEIIEPAKKYTAYKEVKRGNNTSLYVINEKTEMLKYMYINNDLSPELFKNVLFTNPNTVNRKEENTLNKRYAYSDAISEMTVDSVYKSITYVYPAAESNGGNLPSKIAKDSFDFVNDHGGFTGDYRYVSMNLSENQMQYQLYSQGLPVYSHQITTCITTDWGDNHIFRYNRPSFSLDLDITAENEIKELPSGTEVVEKMQRHKSFILSDIDDLVIGYYLSQDENELFSLEPNWFVLYKGNWVLVTPDMLGGAENRLE